MGNVEDKELLYMTHGHELNGGNAGGRGCAGQRGIKGKWDNCNSILNKTYFLKNTANIIPTIPTILLNVNSINNTIKAEDFRQD